MGVDDVERVHAVAGGLAHALAVAVLDDGVDEDVAEGDGAVALASLGTATLRVAIFGTHAERGGTQIQGWRHEIAIHHHHAADPEGDDLACRGEDAGGVERFEEALGLRGLSGIGPAEGGEGPEGGAEPGVEDVGVLDEAIGFEKLDHFMVRVASNADIVELVWDRVVDHVCKAGRGKIKRDSSRLVEFVELCQRVEVVRSSSIRPHRNPMPPPKLP